MQLGARLRHRLSCVSGGPVAAPPAAQPPVERVEPSRTRPADALGPVADRLARALGLSSAPVPARVAPAIARAASPPRGAEGHVGPGWSRTEERVPRATVDLGVLGSRARAWPDAHAIAADLADLTGRTEPPAPPLVLDLETTGLSPGGGAIPAVVGMCDIEGDHVRVQQWVLHRGAAEGAMLADVADVLERAFDRGTTLVTFNGRSFDWPVLAARIVRWHPRLVALRPGVHVDLLAVARRLLAVAPGLPDHRLGTLEDRVLGIDREADVSGADVARILARALVAPGDPWAEAARRRVLAHNRADVLTPLLLASRLAAIVRAPANRCEALGAARHLAAIGKPAAALARLEAIFSHADAGDDTAIAVALAAAELRRRSGDHTGAAALWARVCAWDPGHAIAHERLAKHLEHRRRDPAAALAVARASQAPCGRRLHRLAQKAADRPIPAVETALQRSCEPSAATARV